MCSMEDETLCTMDMFLSETKLLIEAVSTSRVRKQTYLVYVWRRGGPEKISGQVSYFYRAMLAQSAVMRLHVVCLSVRPSVCNVQVP